MKFSAVACQRMTQIQTAQCSLIKGKSSCRLLPCLWLLQQLVIGEQIEPYSATLPIYLTPCILT